MGIVACLHHQDLERLQRHLEMSRIDLCGPEQTTGTGAGSLTRFWSRMGLHCGDRIRIVVNRKGEHLELFVELRAKGFARVRVDGKVVEIDAAPKLAKSTKHTIEVVVDRLKVRDEFKQRLAESFETALRHGDGRAIAVETDTGREHLFSAKFACPVCNYALAELEPRLFSFNSPLGACPKCGNLLDVVYDWAKLPGRSVRVRATWDKVHAIGHIVKDDWFDAASDFKVMQEALR